MTNLLSKQLVALFEENVNPEYLALQRPQEPIDEPSNQTDKATHKNNE